MCGNQLKNPDNLVSRLAPFFRSNVLRQRPIFAGVVAGVARLDKINLVQVKKQTQIWFIYKTFSPAKKAQLTKFKCFRSWWWNNDWLVLFCFVCLFLLCFEICSLYYKSGGSFIELISQDRLRKVDYKNVRNLTYLTKLCS